MKLFDEPDNRARDTLLLSGFVLVMVAGLLIFGSTIGLSILNNSSLDHVSGAWIAIAMDLRDGIFYRPLFDDSAGYGGTRFFPLFFSMIAMVSAVFGSPVVSGHIVSVLSGLLLLMGCYLFMRRTEVKPLFALAMCILLLSAVSIRFGFQTVKGDILPLALNILGLAVYLDKSPGKKSLYLAVLLFVLAFSAKVTAIHGVASLFVWLMISGHRREAGKVLLLTLMGCVAFFVLLYAVTSGRVFEIFEACASGGASITTILKAPVKFSFTLSAYDQTGLLLLFWAVFLFFNRLKEVALSLPAVFLVVSIMLTVLLYGSPGIAFNHLVDIAAASVLFIAYAGFSVNAGNARASTGIYMVLMAFSVSMSLWMFSEGLDEYKSSKQHFPEQLAALVSDSEEIIISEDPALPVFYDNKPYLLDPFMLRLAMKKDAEIRASVINDISSQRYGAIVFIKDPADDPDWYADVHFVNAFMSNVFQHYQQSEKVDGYVIYRPI
jgi:hypothetical protein